MEKSALFDAALDRIMSELDDVEGGSALAHSVEDCPDPLGCTMHDSESAEPLAGAGAEKEAPVGVEIEVKKMGVPSLDGETKAEDGLSPEEAEELRKLLGK